ncbi:MAG: hypothetical protein ACOX1S_11585 [Anaerostipes sp.]|jgi:hypothetical protein
MKIILENLFFPQGFIVLFVVGVIAQIVAWKSYGRMLADSVEMEGKKKRWLGVLRKRFESYYQLEANLNNITCVVDKELYKNKICGFPDKWMADGSLYCAMTCFFLGFLGVLRNCVRGELLEFSVPGFLMFTLAGIALLVIHEVFSVDERKQQIRSNMIYFLENILPNRCEKKERKIENEKKEEIIIKEAEQKEKKKEEKKVKEIEEHWQEIAAAKEFALTPEEIQMMKEILHEI